MTDRLKTVYPPKNLFWVGRGGYNDEIYMPVCMDAGGINDEIYMTVCMDAGGIMTNM